MLGFGAWMFKEVNIYEKIFNSMKPLDILKSNFWRKELNLGQANYI